jgi:hypothetical protein
MRVVLVVAVVGGCLWLSYHWAYKHGYNAANVRAEKIIGEFMSAEADAQRDARKAEQGMQAAVNKLAVEYQRGFDDGKHTEASTVAGLRAGTVRLQDLWRGCETHRLSAGAESARAIDDADQRRAEAAGRVVRVGAECDARQDAWRRYAEVVTQ